jgi:hypothetical protein
VTEQDKDPVDEAAEQETAIPLPERDAMSMIAAPVPFDDPTVPYSEPTEERTPPEA